MAMPVATPQSLRCMLLLSLPCFGGSLVDAVQSPMTAMRFELPGSYWNGFDLEKYSKDGETLYTQDLRDTLPPSASISDLPFTLSNEDDNMVLTHEALKHANFKHRALVTKVANVAKGLMGRIKPNKCSEVKFKYPMQPGKYNKDKRNDHRAIYTNAYFMKQGQLIPIPSKERPASPMDIAYSHSDSDDRNADHSTLKQHTLGAFHMDRDAPDGLGYFTLWMPIIFEQVRQYPIVYFNTSFFDGAYPSPHLTPGGPSEPDIRFWSNMTLGDFVVWDQDRVFHASGQICDLDNTIERAALTMDFECVYDADENHQEL